MLLHIRLFGRIHLIANYFTAEAHLGGRFIAQIILTAFGFVFVLAQVLFPGSVITLASLVWPVPLSPVGRKRVLVVLEAVQTLMWTTTLILNIVAMANWPYGARGWALNWVLLPVVIVAW